jgi:hypothetical protein
MASHVERGIKHDISGQNTGRFDDTVAASQTVIALARARGQRPPSDTTAQKIGAETAINKLRFMRTT